jgi:hypothetical protein
MSNEPGLEWPTLDCSDRYLLIHTFDDRFSSSKSGKRSVSLSCKVLSGNSIKARATAAPGLGCWAEVEASCVPDAHGWMVGPLLVLTFGQSEMPARGRSGSLCLGIDGMKRKRASIDSAPLVGSFPTFLFRRFSTLWVALGWPGTPLHSTRPSTRAARRFLVGGCRQTSKITHIR